ncbi:MAG TPA: hypothetical protein VK960_10275 [Acidimicrobiia bacterium]|nr:hypothetical protein [Acidimicrobiia bacterium]
MPTDTIWIAAVGGGLLVLAATLWLLGRRRRPSVLSPPPPPALDPPVTRLSAGEREAAWSAARAAERLGAARTKITELESRLSAAEDTTSALDDDTDELRSTIAEADREVTELRSALDAAETRIAALETEIAAASRAPAWDTDHVAALEEELQELRDAVARHVATERELRHRLAAAEHAGATDTPEADAELADAHRRIAELESRLASTGPVAPPELQQRIEELSRRVVALDAEVQQLGAERDTARVDAARARDALREARDDADRRVAAAAAEVARVTAQAADLERAVEESSRDAARLVARNAELADLEARLAALSAARDSELRRLNEKIGSMEHLYVEVETRDRRILQLEDEVKSLAESRDEAVAELGRVERQLVTLQGTHAEAMARLDRLGGLERDLEEARTRIVELERSEDSGALRAEVSRLQKTLEGERDRNARLQRRLSLEATTAGKQPSYAEWDRRLRERIDTAVADAVGPLKARIERLRQVVEEKENRIAALAERSRDDGPDDLTRIKGIGPRIRDILHGLGITTFREIASFSDEDVERVGGALPVYGRRILDDGWIDQARELAG